MSRQKSSGQALVTLAGKNFYFGKHGTDESYARYYALLAEYNGNGQAAPKGPEKLAELFIRVRDITADLRHRELPYHAGNQGQYNRFYISATCLTSGMATSQPMSLGRESWIHSAIT